MIISPIKIGIFLGAAVCISRRRKFFKMVSSYSSLKVVIPLYITKVISSPSDLKDYFFESFNTHQFSVLEVTWSPNLIF